jgi:hypothetical protein
MLSGAVEILGLKPNNGYISDKEEDRMPILMLILHVNFTIKILENSAPFYYQKNGNCSVAVRKVLVMLGALNN